MRRQHPMILLALLALGLAPRTLAAQPVPDGPEAVVAESTMFSSCPQVGAAAGGSFEIAWTQGGSPALVLGRHYDANGSPTGPGPVQLSSLDRPEGVEAVRPECGAGAWAGGSWVLTWLGGKPYPETGGSLFMRRFSE